MNDGRPGGGIGVVILPRKGETRTWLFLTTAN